MNFGRTIVLSVPLLALCALHGTAEAYQASVPAMTGFCPVTPGCASAGNSLTNAVLQPWGYFVIPFQTDIITSATNFGVYLNAYQSNYDGGAYANVVVVDGGGSIYDASTDVSIEDVNGYGDGFPLPGMTVPAYGSVYIEIQAGESTVTIGTAEMWH